MPQPVYERVLSRLSGRGLFVPEYEAAKRETFFSRTKMIYGLCLQSHSKNFIEINKTFYMNESTEREGVM